MKSWRKVVKALNKKSTAESKVNFSANDSSETIEAPEEAPDVEGPHVLYEGKDPVIDIIFIHGLRGHPFRTWSVESVCWPRDFLSQHIENARIVTWGYDSSFVNFTKFASQETIVGHAKSLLSDLSFLREDKSRGIVFVGHSLGGLVIKQALIESAAYAAHGRLPNQAKIYTNTKGVVFLGTPHRGSDKASLANIIANVGALVLRQPNKQLVESLDPKSGTLENIRDGFVTISRNLRIVCVREEIPTAVGIIVPAASATIDGHNVEQIGVPEDHMGMARYANSSKIGYKRICSVLQQLAEDEERRVISARTSWIKGVLNFLHYPVIGDREAGIGEAYGETFSWALEDDGFDRLGRLRPASNEERSNPKANASFVSWLMSDNEPLFWLSGKAASGKSTLMKYLYHDARTKDKLKEWTGGADPVIAAFFFFERGDPLQKTRDGLLRSLLYQILSQRRDLVPLVYAADKADRTLPKVTWPALKEAFSQLLNCIPESIKICLFVDGLDEYRILDRAKDYGRDEMHLLSYGTNDDFKDYPEGNWIRDGHHEIASMFQNIKKPNVKVCVASRELAPFEAAYSATPRLRIHELTKNDIHDYVYSQLMGEGNEQFYDSEEVKDIADTVVKHAEGVFLWVRLVVEELKRGQDDGDRIEDLWIKLMRLPKTLGGKNGLYMRMIDMSPSRAEAVKLFQLCSYHKAPPDLEVLFYAADGLYETEHPRRTVFAESEIAELSQTSQTPLRAIKQEIRFLTKDQKQRNLNQLERRLKSRCMGLLEIPRTSKKVQFMHQTAKEFIFQQIRHLQLEEESQECRDLALQFLSAYVLKIKRHYLRTTNNQNTSDRDSIDFCFERLSFFAKLIDSWRRVSVLTPFSSLGESQNEIYFRLMEEAKKLSETPELSPEQAMIRQHFEIFLRRYAPSKEEFRPWDFPSMCASLGLDLYFQIALERGSIEPDVKVELVTELFKSDMAIHDPSKFRIVENILSSGVDLHRKAERPIYAMSAWETLLHFAVNQKQLSRSRPRSRKDGSAIKLIWSVSSIDRNISSQDKVTFVIHGEKESDVTSIWEGSLLQLICTLRQGEYSLEYTELFAKVIGRLTQGAKAGMIDGSDVPPFPDLPSSWKVEVKVSRDNAT